MTVYLYMYVFQKKFSIASESLVSLAAKQIVSILFVVHSEVFCAFVLLLFKIQSVLFPNKD